MRPTESELTHAIYRTSMDSGNWPELIRALAEHIEVSASDNNGQMDLEEQENFIAHFRRAHEISEKLMAKRDDDDALKNARDRVAPEMMLIGSDGKILYNSHKVQQSVDDYGRVDHVLKARIERCAASNRVDTWTEDLIQADHSDDTSENQTRFCLLIPCTQARKLGFLDQAAHLLLSRRLNTAHVVQFFTEQHNLSRSEHRLLLAFLRQANLKAASEAIGITYETARKYLKSVYSKSGVSSQTELVRMLLLNPMTLLSDRTSIPEPVFSQRQFFVAPSGRRLHHFILGPEDGRPLLYIDSMRGRTVDEFGSPSLVSTKLHELGVRLIVLSQPVSRTSGSDVWSSFSELSEDVSAFLDTLALRRLPLLAHGYGANTALGLAAQLPDRFSRITLSSAKCPDNLHPHWRELDFTYHLINIVARKWPKVLDQILPLLAKSMMRDVDRLYDRIASHAKSGHDRSIFRCSRYRAHARRMMSVFDEMEVPHFVEEIRLHAAPSAYDLNQIRPPVTLLHGADDVNVPLASAEYLATRLPNARLHILDGLGFYYLNAEWDWVFGLAASDHPRPQLPPHKFRRGSLLAQSENGLE